MDYLISCVQEAMDIPTSTMVLIAVMCALAMYFIREHLVIPGLIVVIFPLVMALSVAVNYGLTKLEYFSLKRYDQWLLATITSATVGIVVGLVLTMMLARMAGRHEAKKIIGRA